MNNYVTIFYTTPSHNDYGRRLERYCQKYQLDYQWYRSGWLYTLPFWRDNSEILSMRKGGGYWIWKPYIMIDALNRFPGKRVLYVDASVGWDIDPSQYVNDWPTPWICKAVWKQKEWTKRDCFYYMGCDYAHYWEANHVWAGCMMASINDGWFLREYQTYLCDPRIVTDRPNACGLPNFPEFKDHRHDQSVLANMAEKYSIPLQNMPFMGGNSLIHDVAPNVTAEQV